MRLLVALVAFLLAGCAANPFVIQQVNGHLYRSPQPKTAADWQQLAVKLGHVGVVVKLNDSAEGDESGATAAGLRVVPLAIEPKGDGPIYAQVEGVFIEPDPVKVAQAVALACDQTIVVDVHCSHGWDRTGYVIARERVQCDGWTPESAHDEWHRIAQYVPYGDRIPAPGLEAAWEDFVEQLRAPGRAKASVDAAGDVLDAVAAP